MHPTVASFQRRAQERYGYGGEIREFDEGTKTAAAAADAIGCARGQIIKSILMRVGDGFCLVLTSGDHRVDEAALATERGVEPEAVSTAAAEEVKSVTGWSIGGVPPFCHEQTVPTLADPTFRSHDTLWGAAGTPNAMLSVTPEQLVAFTDATYVDVYE
jgi:prolyl-tRNA editing enzyme YbaK/EbsC (Cys-tRNA(Pro) deacylase)